MAGPDIVEAEDGAPISGDILEAILSYAPLIDLVPALRVSKAWNKAVYSSLHSLNPPKPWLFLHRQRVCSPFVTKAYAYDPRSQVWMDISQPSLKYTSALRSSHSNFLFMLSPSKFSFSFDPLNLMWHHVEAPLVWRQDPIVAKVGDSVVVAGGAWDFENDPLAVEIYDMKTSKWRSCESMPSSLKDTTSSIWLSIAASSKKLFVMQKYSGVIHFFDVESSDWSSPQGLCPDPRCFYSVIGFLNNRLILVGLIGNNEIVEEVKIWEVGCEDFMCKEIGEMPVELAEKIKTEYLGCSIDICSAGSFVYIYNPNIVEEVVVCELVNGDGGCSWGSVKNLVHSDSCGLDRLAFTCAEVSVEDLQRAMRMNDRRYSVVSV